MPQVEHYGLFWDGPVAWLLQGRGGSNFVGLREKTPFRVAGGMCNHLIPPAAPIPDRIHWEKFLEIVNDPLVRAMLPIPRPEGSRAFFVEDPYNDLAFHLASLSRLSSPIKGVVRPLWTVKVKDLEKELSSTNVQPLVLTQAEPKGQPVVDAIGDFSMMLPRTTILTGRGDMVVQKPMQRITTQIRNFDIEDLLTLPMENIGAAVLRRHARNEPIDAPMESRQARRERQIQERS